MREVPTVPRGSAASVPAPWLTTTPPQEELPGPGSPPRASTH